MKANVLEILSKKGTSLDGRQMEIAATAFYNRESNKKELLSGINAFVFFYDENYKKQNGFELTNAAWATTKTTLAVGKNKQSGGSGNNIESGNCELWGYFVDHYDPNGVLLYSTLLYTYYVGDCNEGGGPVTDPNESGDPEGCSGCGEPPPLILNNVTDPCMYNSVEYAISRDCKNKVTSFINTTFANSATNHLRFYNYAFGGTLANSDAHTVTGPGTNILETYTNITLNNSQLSSASREYIGATILHEAIHAWINYTYPNPVDNATQHNLMASTSRFEILRSAILEMYPGLSPQDATDLTWGGMYNTILYSTLLPAERHRIEQRNLDFKFRRNNTGTPC